MVMTSDETRIQILAKWPMSHAMSHALPFYASGSLLQAVGDTTGADKSTVSLAVHNADAIFHSAYSQEIALWDANCRLARQYKWFLHHVLTVNQRLTNLPSNRTLNNVLKSSD